MQLNWHSRAGAIPVATITHRWANVPANMATIANNIRHVFDRKVDDPSLIREYVRHVFISRNITFEAQQISIDHDAISAEVMDIGAAYDTVMLLQKFFTSVSASPLSENDVIQTAKQSNLYDVRSQGHSNDALKRAAFFRGYDIIRKDSARRCYAIRNRYGESTALLENFTFTDRTGYIATQMSTNKIWTMNALSLAGLPVPESLLANNMNDAVNFAAKSKPRRSVVKPVGTDFGIAVFTNLQSAEEVATAYQIAAKHGSVLIQEHVPGEDYRILIVDGVVAGITRRKPFHVVGNGADTIEQLARDKIAQRAGHDFYRQFNKIDPNSPEIATTLRRQGLAMTDVLATGVVARLRDNPNVSSGGEHEIVDVAECHPDNLDLAIDAASVIGLDLAGIDFLSADIAKSWRENGAKICEINPTPAMSVSAGIDLLLNRLNGSSRDASISEGGDTLLITNGPGSTAALPSDGQSPKYDQDLDELDERKYFYQSYLAKKQAPFRMKISLERLLLYGCPNRHVSRAILDTELAINGHVAADIKRRLPPACVIESGAK